MLNSTILNPRFITSELDRLNVSSLAEELLSEQPPEGEFPEELRTALVNNIPKVEPLVKEKVSAATYSIYDYLLGKSQNIDLALTLRNSLLSTDFAVSLADKLNISSLARDFLSKQLTEKMPEEVKQYVAESLDKVTIEHKPWLKEQVSAAADPTLDYLVGKNKGLNIVISLEPVKQSLKDALREAFLKSPPRKLAGVAQAEQEQYSNQFSQEVSAQIPPTFEINEGLLGTDTPAKIAEALAEAEGKLEQARQVIGYFQPLYKALIGFMLILVLGIILINHQVKGAIRGLGTTFLTYGAFEYVGIFIAKHFAGTRLPLSEMPSSLQTWLPQFLDNLLAPLQIFSLGLLIGGIVLIVVSLVYQPPQSLP